MTAAPMEVLFGDTSLAVELSGGRAFHAGGMVSATDGSVARSTSRMRISSSGEGPHWDEFDEAPQCRRTARRPKGQNRGSR
jgi:hypothetical protein